MRSGGCTEERDELIAAEARGEAIDGDRLQGPGGVLEQLQLDADTVETRATQLLVNQDSRRAERAPHVGALWGLAGSDDAGGGDLREAGYAAAG